MNNLINWLIEYPSRIPVCEGFLIAILYCIMIHAKTRKKPHINKRRFVYCENGRKNNIVYVEMVTQDVFDNYEQYVGYPILDMNNNTIYFALPNNR